MAGFLALSEKSAFPSMLSGFDGLSIMEMTVAGTAQDLHLIPFYCMGESPSASPIRLQRYKLIFRQKNKRNKKIPFLCAYV
jgi:hypothetical protein